MNFETFIAMLAMCGFHDKFPSRITFKNIDSLNWSIVHWLISSLTLSFSLFCLGLKTTKFDSIIFIESFLARHQSVKLSNSSVKVFKYHSEETYQVNFDG